MTIRDNLVDFSNPAWKENALELYIRTGCLVFRDAECLQKDVLQFEAYFRTIQDRRQIDAFNGVHTPNSEELEPLMAGIEHSTRLRQVLAQIYDLAEDEVCARVGVLGGKLLVKDYRFDGEVFLHQDSCYQIGRNNTTIFFTLTDCDRGASAESALRCLLGTHRFGHLGDAGEIDRSILPDSWPELCFAMPRHHFMVMDPHVWHYSHAADLGEEVRAIYTLTVNAIPEPWTRRLGQFCSEQQPLLSSGNLFKRSRSSRIRELQKQVDLQG